MTRALFLALAAAVASPLRAQNVQVNPGRYRNCVPAGTAKASNMRALNVLKNRATFPAAASIRHDVTAVWIMSPSKDDSGRFDHNDAVTIRLFVTNVKPGGIETSNCGVKAVPNIDTHIEGNATGPDYKGEPMIVEVTPRWRAAMRTAGEDWSTPALKAQLVGHWVEFTGWLFEDEEHRVNAVNTHDAVKHKAGGHPDIWRQTTWEVHPVTAMRVVTGPQ